MRGHLGWIVEFGGSADAIGKGGSSRACNNCYNGARDRNAPNDAVTSLRHKERSLCRHVGDRTGVTEFGVGACGVHLARSATCKRTHNAIDNQADHVVAGVCDVDCLTWQDY